MTDAERMVGVKTAKGPTIRLRSGRYFDLTDPEGSDFTIDDVAHALAHICRFTGHTRVFYSVAEHSVLCSYLVPSPHSLAALLHDAAEAFVGDVSRPLKLLLPDYKAIEARVERAVLGHFGVTLPLPASVKAADNRMLAHEQVSVMDSTDTWPGLAEAAPLPPDVQLGCWPPEVAKAAFLRRYHQIMDRR